MRHLKFISMMMAVLAAVCVTFTSCDDDDDNNTQLTPEQVKTAFNSVRGDYSGNMVYSTTSGGKTVTDTVAMRWSIQSDSVMTIYDFPVALLGNNITDTVARQALQQAGTQDIRCAIGFIQVSPAAFLINPASPTLNLTYGGKSHTLQFPFYINNGYSFGTLSNTQLRMQIILAGVYEDGKQQSSWLKQGVPFDFIATKK